MTSSPQGHPEFVLIDGCWAAKVSLPSWTGFAVDEDTPSDETQAVDLTFAPEGRDEQPLTEKELALVGWVVDHEEQVLEAALQGLYEYYPKAKEQLTGFLDDETLDELYPAISSKYELKGLLYIPSIHIHPIFKDGVPFIGVEFECEWDVEHGVGIVMHGTTVHEVGEASNAFMLWCAEQYAN